MKSKMKQIPALDSVYVGEIKPGDVEQINVLKFPTDFQVVMKDGKRISIFFHNTDSVFGYTRKHVLLRDLNTNICSKVSLPQCYLAEELRALILKLGNYYANEKRISFVSLDSRPQVKQGLKSNPSFKLTTDSGAVLIFSNPFKGFAVRTDITKRDRPRKRSIS